MIAANSMSTDMVTVGCGEGVDRVVELMCEKRAPLAVVLDDALRAVGVVTPERMLRYTVESGTGPAGEPRPPSEKSNASSASSSLAGLLGNVEALSSRKVGEIMESAIVTVGPGTPVEAVGALLLSSGKGVECVIVVDDGGRPLGCITTADMVRRLWAHRVAGEG